MGIIGDPVTQMVEQISSARQLAFRTEKLANKIDHEIDNILEQGVNHPLRKAERHRELSIVESTSKDGTEDGWVAEDKIVQLRSGTDLKK